MNGSALCFACAHPAIDASVRARLDAPDHLGFDAATIASASLVPTATWASAWSGEKIGIVRPRHTSQGPRNARDALAERLGSVLEAIDAALPKVGPSRTTPTPGGGDLSDEGIWLGRLRGFRCCPEPEAQTCSPALMLSARRDERRTQHSGRPTCPSPEQDTAEWDSR